MAILLSFIVALLATEIFFLKGRNRILAIVSLALMAVTLWWLPQSQKDLVHQSEKIIRLLNHPEDRADHPIDQFTRQPVLQELVNQSFEPNVCVPAGSKIRADGIGIVRYNVYFSTDTQIFRRDAEFQFKMRFGGDWEWVQLVLGEPVEIDGDPFQEEGLEEAMSAWYNRG